MRSLLLFAYSILFLFTSNAQSITPRASYHVNVGLPVNLTNESFKGIMQGLINVSTHYQYTMENTFCIGAGINFTYFSLNEFKISEPVSGGVFMPSAFLKLGQEKFHSQNFGTDVGLKMGYTMNYFKSDSIMALDGAPRELGCLYVEPNVGLMLLMDESTTIKLAIGYVIQNFGFRPTLMGLKSDGAYSPNGFDRITQYLTIGFGYTHYFKSKR